MELDYTSIKALSSPTRIKILHTLLSKDTTPTHLSDELDKSKSTISSHLSTLQDAGLVEKDAEEGRRRVTYTATDKARAIVEGRERTVKFSVSSSILTSIAGVAVLGSQFMPTFSSGDETTEGASGDVMIQSADAAQNGAPEAAQAGSSLLGGDTPMLIAGVALLGIGAITMYYGYMLHKLAAE